MSLLVGVFSLFLLLLFCFIFFFKQKTAYEMRISDWSSDVCSSDLPIRDSVVRSRPAWCLGLCAGIFDDVAQRSGAVIAQMPPEIGRASCRERVCQYV